MPENTTHTPPVLLVVDDEPSVVTALTRVFRRTPFRVLSAASGTEGLATADGEDIAVVVSDQRMPEMDGVSFLSALHANQPDAEAILLTGYADHQDIVKAINESKIFGYLQKPWNDDELRALVAKALDKHELVRENLRLVSLLEERNLELKRFNTRLEERVRQRTDHLKKTIRGGVEMLALASEAKDDDTGEHVRRINDLSCSIALAMGLSHAEAEQIGFFSMMHDVGKIHIPDAILNKPGKLTADEWRTMQTHTTAGEQILGDGPYYRLARRIARSHHERWDGTGYPDGLAGETIPMAARIVAVADVYDALTHVRPYKPAWSPEEALAEIDVQSGKAFDPAVVDAFRLVMANVVPEPASQ